MDSPRGRFDPSGPGVFHDCEGGMDVWGTNYRIPWELGVILSAPDPVLYAERLDTAARNGGLLRMRVDPAIMKFVVLDDQYADFEERERVEGLG